MPEVISNTSPLQYLYQIALLDVLRSLYVRVTIPEAVVAELAEGRARGVALPDPAGFPWMYMRPVRDRSLLPQAAYLGPGEQEVLALGLEAPGSLLLLDDAVARLHAKSLGLTFTGTLGVLLRAKQTGCVRALTPILDRLEALRFRLDSRTRKAVVTLAGETV